MNKSCNNLLENFILDNIEVFSQEIKQKLNEIYIIILKEKCHPCYNDGIKNVAIQLMMGYIAKSLIKPCRGKRTTSVTIRNRKFRQRVVPLTDEYKDITDHLNQHAEHYWDLMGEDNQNAVMHIVNEGLVYADIYPLGEYIKHPQEQRTMAELVMNLVFNELMNTIILKDKYIRNYATC